MVELVLVGQSVLPSPTGSTEMNSIRRWVLVVSLLLASTFGALSEKASAATAAELNANGKAALSRLYAQSDRAKR